MPDGDKSIIETVKDTIGASGALAEAALLAAKREFPAGEKVIGAVVTTIEAVEKGIEDVEHGESIEKVASDVTGVVAVQGSKVATVIGATALGASIASNGVTNTINQVVAPIAEKTASLAQKGAEFVTKAASQVASMAAKGAEAVADTHGIAKKGAELLQKTADSIKSTAGKVVEVLTDNAARARQAAQLSDEAAELAAQNSGNLVKGVAKGAALGIAVAAEAVNVGWAMGEKIHEGKGAGEVLLEGGKASSVGQIATTTHAAIEAHYANMAATIEILPQTDSNKADKNNMPSIGTNSYPNMAGFAHSGTDSNKLSPNYPPELGIKNCQDPSYIREQMAKTQDKIDKTQDDRGWYDPISKHPAHYEKIRVASAGQELEAYEKRFNEAVKNRSNSLEETQLAQDKAEIPNEALKLGKRLQEQGVENKGGETDVKPPTVAQTKQVDNSVGLA